MTACTCYGRNACLACQLEELDLIQAADLLLLDPFVVAAAEMDRRLADAFANSNVHPIRPPKGQL